MSLSDKYGGNIDLNQKYGNPNDNSEEKRSKTAAIRPEYSDGKNIAYGYNRKEIELDNSLDQEHINLLMDAYDYIDTSRFKSVIDAYEAGIFETGYLQVWSMNMKNLVLVPLSSFVYSEDTYGRPTDHLKPRNVFNKDLYQYYLTDLIHEREVIINVSLGTFERSTDYANGIDAKTAKIVFFIDGSIYVDGLTFIINDIPVDYLSRVLDECINGINSGRCTKYLQEASANIVLEYERQCSNNPKQYIKRHDINYIHRL